MRLPTRTFVGASVLSFVSLSNGFSRPFPNSSQSSSVAGIKTVAVSGENGLAPFQEALENSWVRNLSTETEINYQRSRSTMALPEEQDNRTKRPVFNGHYVPVAPTGIKNPRLVLYSQDVAENLLHLSDSESNSDDFVNFVSGNLILGETWATPYALSIMGKRYTSNCPFGTGDGYGDGRAISIGEAHGYELQLKGAGPTPFHRGADGRAVLRSSIREFLASEAMHWLGVPTTRALSLVLSENGDTVNRPWYSNDVVMQIPKMNDPRLEQYSEKQKREIIQRLRQQKADPNMMISEPCAITCRVSPSFTRIGHLDLFARRAERQSQLNADETDSRYDTSTLEWKELEDMIWHACYREFREEAYEPYYEEKNIEKAGTVLLERSAEKIATMVAHWIRVGFAQGNFNADNCLVGGRTMDYGPFGWMEEYSPVFAKWTGSGEHFGFFNQPNAGYANYEVLVTSVIQVICAAKGEEDQDETYAYFMNRAQSLFQEKLAETLRVKLGFQADEDIADDLWENLEPLLRSSRTDWTLFWRQLTNVAQKLDENLDSEDMVSLLQGEGDASPFYEKLESSTREQWISWLEQWRDLLDSSQTKNIHEHMRTTNPKYVLREWMLVNAYTDAGLGDESTLQELYQLIQDPYGEGTPSQQEKFYRRAPDSALTTGGTAFMS